jgi:hypothetical protein
VILRQVYFVLRHSLSAFPNIADKDSVLLRSNHIMLVYIVGHDEQDHSVDSFTHLSNCHPVTSPEIFRVSFGSGAFFTAMC